MVFGEAIESHRGHAAIGPVIVRSIQVVVTTGIRSQRGIQFSHLPAGGGSFSFAHGTQPCAITVGYTFGRSLSDPHKVIALAQSGHVGHTSSSSPLTKPSRPPDGEPNGRGVMLPYPQNHV